MYKINDLIKVTVSHPARAKVGFFKNRVGRICKIEESDDEIVYVVAFPHRRIYRFDSAEFVLATDIEIRNTLIKVLEPHYYV